MAAFYQKGIQESGEILSVSVPGGFRNLGGALRLNSEFD